MSEDRQDAFIDTVSTYPTAGCGIPRQQNNTVRLNTVRHVCPSVVRRSETGLQYGTCGKNVHDSSHYGILSMASWLVSSLSKYLKLE